ncbi:MAG: TerB family tellurite resistance protein [Myxococcota bacterium]
MGILANIFDNIDNPEEVERALIHTVCLAVWSDDELTEEEYTYAVSCVSELLDVDDEAAEEVVEAAFATIEEDSFEEVMLWVADELEREEDRERAFMCAVGALYADGEIAWDEEDFLVSFAQHLHLDDARVQELIEQVEEEYEEV